MLRLKLLFLLFFTVTLANAQRSGEYLIINGTVLGYTYDDSKSLFKRNKNIELEGSLTNVSIVITNNQQNVVEKGETSKGGEFDFRLKVGKKYLLTYSKDGYGTSAFEIDLRSIPSETAEWGLVLKNIEIILNNFESDKPQDNGYSFGRLYFDKGNEMFAFDVREFEQKKKLFKKNEENTSVNLMVRSLNKNAKSNRVADATYEANHNESTNSRRRPHGSAEADTIVVDTLTDNFGVSNALRQSKSELNMLDNMVFFHEGVGQEDIDELGDQIQKARELLEQDKLNAVTELDFLSIAAREQLLSSAERELENARIYIGAQQDKINTQQNLIYAVGVVVLLLLVFGVFIWQAYKSKKKSHVILSEKNKKITDSINYALRIQQSVLLTDEQIKNILPKSCVYYQPLDSVSGDFYWFSKVNDKTVIAAVDCTGHGVPGAFMSLIGNTLLNQIVNEKEITKPAEILKHLHEGIVLSLRQTDSDESAQDGMDISICCIDHGSGKLSFSGAMNSVYVFQGDEIKTLQADLQTIGGFTRRKARPFKEHEMAINKGDRIYLFSDGFMDQFGGESDEKFNISRFKELIVSLKDVQVHEQKASLETAFNQWRGNTSQIDDVLVIGVEV
mgnify:CR=1 FL=1